MSRQRLSLNYISNREASLFLYHFRITFLSRNPFSPCLEWTMLVPAAVEERQKARDAGPPLLLP